MNINIVRDLHVSQFTATVIAAGLQGCIESGMYSAAENQEMAETVEQLNNLLSSFPDPDITVAQNIRAENSQWG